MGDWPLQRWHRMPRAISGSLHAGLRPRSLRFGFSKVWLPGAGNGPHYISMPAESGAGFVVGPSMTASTARSERSRAVCRPARSASSV